MTPLKANKLFPEVAKELELGEDVVEAAVDFYWKEIRKELIEPTHITISCESFGVFEARIKQIEYLIEKYTRISKYMKPTTYAKHTLLNILTEKLARLEKLLEMCKLQDEKKKQIRQIQKDGKTV